jgi:hypothetical protein
MSSDGCVVERRLIGIVPRKSVQSPEIFQANT